MSLLLLLFSCLNGKSTKQIKLNAEKNNCMCKHRSNSEYHGIKCLFAVRKVHLFRKRIAMLWPSFCPLAVGETFERVSATVTLGPCHAPAFHRAADKNKKNPCISMVTTGIKKCIKTSQCSREKQWQQVIACSPDAWQKCTTLRRCMKHPLPHIHAPVN